MGVTAGSGRPAPAGAYRPDIDGLRGIAVLSVVAYHALPRALPGGFAGVDVFFVISGFLITRILLGELAGGTFSLAAFYGRRIRRIFPGVALVTAACLVAGGFLLLPEEYALLGKHVAAGAGFVSNLVSATEVGYFDVAAESKPLLHLWSLGIEEQFYIAWPLLLWLAWRARGCRPLPFAVGTLLLAGLASWLAARDPVGAFYSPFARAWELAAGALLATLPPARAGTSAPRSAMAWFGLAAMAVAFATPADAWPFAGSAPVVPVIGTALAIAAGPAAWPNRALLAARWLVGIGLISYPLYLWHWPLLSFARIVAAGRPAPVTIAGVLAIAFVLAWLTWRLLERPVRRTPRRRAVTAMLLAAVTLVGAAGFAVYRADGLPDRTSVRAQPVVGDFAPPGDWKHDPACQRLAGLPRQTFCAMSADRPPSVALIGDSHALALYPYVDAYYAARGRGVITMGRGGCPPLPGVDRNLRGCPAKLRRALDYVIGDPAITDVVVMARWSLIERGEEADAATPADFYALSVEDAPAPAPGDRRRIVAEGLDRLITTLQAGGKRVTLVYGLPELDFDPHECLPGRGGRRCEIARTAVEAWQAGYRPILAAAAARDGVRGVDLARAFCDRRRCTAIDGGRILYRDAHHLSRFGTDYLREHGVRLD